MAQSTALASVELPRAPLAKVEELRSTLARLSESVNLVVPVVQQDYIPPMHRVSLRAVVVQPGDCYADSKWCKEGEQALGKTGLLKILQAAGGSVSWSRRMDDRSDPYYCEWAVMVRYRQLDGQWIEVQGSKELDLRDGSPEAKGQSDRQLQQSRRHIQPMAETKALLRAIRAALALRQKYTQRELQRPFVVPALVPDLPMDDPRVRDQYVGAMLGAQAALYGPVAPAPVEPFPRAVGPGIDEPIPIEGEALEVVGDDLDPWDQAEASVPPCLLPVPSADVEACQNETRKSYLIRLNAYASQLPVDQLEMLAAGVDPMQAPLGELVELGRKLAAAVKGGR